MGSKQGDHYAMCAVAQMEHLICSLLSVPRGSHCVVASVLARSNDVAACVPWLPDHALVKHPGQLSSNTSSSDCKHGVRTDVLPPSCT